MAKHTCCDCGKEFEEDMPGAEVSFEVYGKIPCPECSEKRLKDILGVNVDEHTTQRSCYNAKPSL